MCSWMFSLNVNRTRTVVVWTPISAIIHRLKSIIARQRSSPKVFWKATANWQIRWKKSKDWVEDFPPVILLLRWKIFFKLKKNHTEATGVRFQIFVRTFNFSFRRLLLVGTSKLCNLFVFCNIINWSIQRGSEEKHQSSSLLKYYLENAKSQLKEKDQKIQRQWPFRKNVPWCPRKVEELVTVINIIGCLNWSFRTLLHMKIFDFALKIILLKAVDNCFSLIQSTYDMYQSNGPSQGCMEVLEDFSCYKHFK